MHFGKLALAATCGGLFLDSSSYALRSERRRVYLEANDALVERALKGSKDGSKKTKKGDTTTQCPADEVIEITSCKQDLTNVNNKLILLPVGGLDCSSFTFGSADAAITISGNNNVLQGQGGMLKGPYDGTFGPGVNVVDGIFISGTNNFVKNVNIEKFTRGVRVAGSASAKVNSATVKNNGVGLLVNNAGEASVSDSQYDMNMFTGVSNDGKLSLVGSTANENGVYGVVVSAGLAGLVDVEAKNNGSINIVIDPSFGIKGTVSVTMVNSNSCGTKEDVYVSAGDELGLGAGAADVFDATTSSGACLPTATRISNVSCNKAVSDDSIPTPTEITDYCDAKC